MAEFKAGDHVEVHWQSKWRPGTVVSIQRHGSLRVQLDDKKVSKVPVLIVPEDARAAAPAAAAPTAAAPASGPAVGASAPAAAPTAPAAGVANTPTPPGTATAPAAVAPPAKPNNPQPLRLRDVKPYDRIEFLGIVEWMPATVHQVTVNEIIAKVDDPDYKDLVGGPPFQFRTPRTVRTWTDRSGNFKVEAALIHLEKDQLTLKTAAGKQIKISVDQLGDEDQAFVKTLASGPYNRAWAKAKAKSDRAKAEPTPDH